MAFFKRFFYFILTGILVALTVQFAVGLIAQLFGFNLYSGGYQGLFILCLIWGFAGSFISLQLSRWMAKRFHGVELIEATTTNPRERKLIDFVYRLARASGMDTMPEVGIYSSTDVNAFATGASKSRALVAVSSGLMDTMSDSELEGVLAHEIAHIVNGDMVTLALIQGVVNAFAMFFAHLVTMFIMNAIRKSDDDDRRGFGDFMLRQMIYSFVSIAFTLLGSIVVNYFSRQREFRADAGGARFASRDKMTSALLRLQKLYEIPYEQKNSEEGADKLATLKISGKSKGISSLFMTHPPLEERIAALRNSGAI